MKKLLFFILFALSSQATFAQEAIQKVTNGSSDISSDTAVMQCIES